MKVSVIGTGYVGLVAGACFADTGNEVSCVDIDPRKIDALKNGKIPIYEPGLEEIVKRTTKEGRLKFTTSAAESVAQAEVVFFAIGTPPLPSGEPNLSYLKSAAEEVARAMRGPIVAVNKSTVPIGTHRQVAEWMRPFTKHAFEVVSNPEFLKEGTAIDDFLRPDRVVIGTKSDAAFKKMEALYAPFVRQGNPIIRMDPVSAEMTKYACNAFLATRISFMNELARLCDRMGGDVDQIRRGMATDVRIGKHFLYAGAGYGGSCFPKDVQALMATGRKEGVEMAIVTAAEDANAVQKRYLFDRISKHFGGESRLKGKKFAVWGLAFKPNTDDMREAPSLTLIEQLVGAGASVTAFDPVAQENAEALLAPYGEAVKFASGAFDALTGADALVLVTEWNEFRNVDFGRVKAALKQPLVFDGRNVYAPEMLRELGFQYYGIGRG